MSDQTLQSPVKHLRWRTWYTLLLVALLVFGGLYLFSIIRQAQAESHLRALIAEIEKDDPHWGLKDLEAEQNKLPVSPAFLKCIAAVPPDYRGWAGDDITSRIGALDYHPSGCDYNVRFPEEYYQILKERILEARIQPTRQGLLELAREPSGYRLPQGAKNSLSHIEDVRRIANKIYDESIFAAHEGNGDHVILSFQMAMNNSRVL